MLTTNIITFITTTGVIDITRLRDIIGIKYIICNILIITITSWNDIRCINNIIDIKTITPIYGFYAVKNLKTIKKLISVKSVKSTNSVNIEEPSKIKKSVIKTRKKL